MFAGISSRLSSQRDSWNHLSGKSIDSKSEDNDSNRNKGFFSPLSSLNFLNNKRVSLRSQLILSFSLTTLIFVGATIGLCLGLFSSLAASSKNDALPIIKSNAELNLDDLSTQLADALIQRLVYIGQAETLVSTLYGKLLLSYSNESNAHGSTLLAPMPSYREYHLDNCSAAVCPPDYGPIAQRTRLPYNQNFMNGSLESSSVYLYSSAAQMALRTDESWNSAVVAHPELQVVIDGLVYQDLDFNVMYNKGPNTTLNFYLTAKVIVDKSSGEYFAIHRTFPGISINSSSYDPTVTTWFTGSMENEIYLNTPQNDEITGELAFSLSSLKNVYLKGGQHVELVFSASIMSDVFTSFLKEAVYTGNGFGAIVNYDTKEVIAWGQQDGIFDTTQRQFKTISYYDPVLATYSLQDGTIIEYTDQYGDRKLADVKVFYKNNNIPLLVLLTIVSVDSAEHPYVSLTDNINASRMKIIIIVVAIIGAAVITLISLLTALVVNLTKPLNAMQRISQDIIRISGEAENKRDYSSVKKRAEAHLDRRDEIGMLMDDYYYVITQLDEKAEEKQKIPKFPSNPFYVKGQSNYSKFRWNTLKPLLENALKTHNERLHNESSRPASPTKINAKKNAVVPLNSDLEHGNAVAAKESVGFFSTIRFKLYTLSLILLVGVVLTLVVTIIQLTLEGNKWIRDSQVDLKNGQQDSLRAIAIAKASNIQVLRL